ncbi:MAG: dihydroneopterin aldolase [bacterium]|nr:dihydroneopterin aldolase [bacterium]
MPHKDHNTDKIHIRDLKVNIYIGAEESERVEKQDLILNITLMLDLRLPGETDKLVDTVDYRDLALEIVEKLSETAFYLLEALAEKVASICLGNPHVRKVQVIIDKPGAIQSASSAAVEIIRGRL